MPVRYADESGQISVFLSLLFLVLLSFSLCIIEGVRNYGSSYLAETVIKSAGENVMANYDKELFNNYHIFFLDPRERAYILSDGRQYIEQSFSDEAFFSVGCRSLDITEEKTAVDENGLYLKHEIREWMKYREERKIQEKLKALIKNTEKNNEERQACITDVEAAKREESKREEAVQKEQIARQDTTGSLDIDNTGEATVDSEVVKERAAWKEIQQTLQLCMKTGVLFYAADQPSKLSKQSISTDGLPSNNRGSFSKTEEAENGPENTSFSNIKEISKLLSEDISLDIGGSLWTKENYILSYIEDCFSFYGCEDSQDAGKKHSENMGNRALLYETEYLIAGRKSDIDNLKKIANDILMLRFVANYIFTGKDTQLKAQIDAMAAAVTGVMGMPQAVKAVQVLIRIAISYSESLLELHTLLSGGEVPLIKNRSNWNVELKTLVKQLKEKAAVKKGSHNVTYFDYLKMLLLKKHSTDLCYRMMDIMQVNIAGKEAGFLMENCLFSYKWQAGLSIGTIQMKLERQNNY